MMEFIAKEVSPTSYINIMDQYFPEFKAQQYPKLDRRITRTEFLKTVDAAKSASPYFRLPHELEGWISFMIQ